MKGVSNKRLKKLRESPCWEWPATLGHNGYAQRFKDGKNIRIQRVVYEAVIEDIPEGLVTDHLCRNRKCVNPFHIEPVTSKVNILRGESFCAKNKRKTHCKQGHPFSGSNLLFNKKKNGRDCRKCANAAQARFRKRRKEKLCQK